jgi:hypothetical protein
MLCVLLVSVCLRVCCCDCLSVCLSVSQDAVAKTEANITFGGGALASDLENLDKNITDDMKKEAVSVATTVHEDASVLWPGKNEDLDDLERIADFPEIAQSLPPEAVSPAQQFFAVIKWLVGVVWVLLVLLLRANARKRFDIDARVSLPLSVSLSLPPPLRTFFSMHSLSLHPRVLPRGCSVFLACKHTPCLSSRAFAHVSLACVMRMSVSLAPFVAVLQPQGVQGYQCGRHCVLGLLCSLRPCANRNAHRSR